MNNQLPINSIRMDGGTQPRASIDGSLVAEYRADMMAGATFPPVTVFFDGSDYWLADGFHRVKAAQQLGENGINADVRQGTRRDAVLHSVGANGRHGLRRNNEDKRRAVTMLLEDQEWSKWSNWEIAKRCDVSHTFVNNLRVSLETVSSENRTFTTKHGTIATMNTANIGGNGHHPNRYADPDTGIIVDPDTEEAWDGDFPDSEEDENPDTDEISEVDLFTGEILDANDVPQYEPDPESIPQESRPMAKANFITLPAWQAMSDEEQRNALTLTLKFGRTSKFNSQDSDNIEWAKWSWNPVTGCKHDCPYCYARDIANRFYEQKFEPAFLPERLHAPFNTVVPQIAQTDIGYKNVFTCSMADLFGRWVPTEWIDAVLDAVRSAPQWNFLFLTKFPIRLSEFEFPDNAWVGTTVDCQARVKNAENAFRKVKAAVKWLSCEPMLEPLEFSDLGMFQWIVIGGSSHSTQTPEWHPPRQWVTKLEAKAYEVNCRVYEKSNLFAQEMRVRDYPGSDSVVQRLPQSLRYLPSIEGGAE